MRIKEKIVEIKDKAIDWVDDHATEVIWGGLAIVVGGTFIWLKGAMDGVKSARREWNFDNDTSEWAVIMEENGEYRTAVPMSVLKEVMDKHKPIEWNNSMWKR